MVLYPACWVTPQLTVVSAPSFNQALECMRGTAALRGWCPTRWWHMQRQQFPDRPAMIREASGHRWCGPAPGVGQTGMWCAEMIDRPDQIHAMLQRQGVACQRRLRRASAARRSRNVAFSRSMYAVLLTPAPCDRRRSVSTRAGVPSTMRRSVATTRRRS